MLSLFNLLKKKSSCFRKLIRVSPPLVGVVLLCFPVMTVLAYFSGDLLVLHKYHNSGAYISSGTTQTYTYNSILSTDIFQDMELGRKYIITFTPYVNMTDISSVKVLTEEEYPCSGSVSLKNFEVVLPGSVGTYPCVIGKPNTISFTYEDLGNFSVNCSVNCLAFWLSSEKRYVWWKYDIYMKDVSISIDTNLTDNEALNAIVQQNDKMYDQQQQFHDEEIEAGNKSGSDAEGLVSDLNNVKSKWEILWYPITFTNNLYAAVTGGGAAYSSRSGGITGYRYDNDIGELIPIYNRARDGTAASGTVLTFPAFTLPVLNVQVWDSYTFDLASVKEQLPMVFDAIYVIFTVVEVVWFVKFLQKKFHEVFG